MALVGYPQLAIAVERPTEVVEAKSNFRILARQVPPRVPPSAASLRSIYQRRSDLLKGGSLLQNPDDRMCR